MILFFIYLHCFSPFFFWVPPSIKHYFYYISASFSYFLSLCFLFCVPLCVELLWFSIGLSFVSCQNASFPPSFISLLMCFAFSCFTVHKLTVTFLTHAPFSSLVQFSLPTSVFISWFFNHEPLDWTCVYVPNSVQCLVHIGYSINIDGHLLPHGFCSLTLVTRSTFLCVSTELPSAAISKEV